MASSEHKAMPRSTTTTSGFNPSELRRDPLALAAAIRATFEVRGVCGRGSMPERYNIIRMHAMYGSHCA